VRSALEAYLKAPAPDVVLVLMAGGEKAKEDKALSALTTAIEFEPLSEERLVRWIAHQASQRAARITPAAASLLMQAVGNDLPALASELDKLVSYAGDAEIDEPAVAAVVGVRRGETLADLLDRVAARDAAGALAILPAVLNQPKASAVTTVMALGTQTLALAWGGAVKGRPDYFGLLREGSSAYTGRPWNDATDAWHRATRSWSGAELDTALDALLTADVALKETGASTDAQRVATLVLSLCASARS
jgi:DNA polymerase-3 subunit delta